jgi:hypothetical protein
MSLDYQNYEDWLAARMKITPPLRYLHVSGFGRAARRSMPQGVSAGTTYDARRNSLKRAKRAARELRGY